MLVSSEVSKVTNKQKGLFINDGGKAISKQETPILLADAMKASSSSKNSDFSKEFNDDLFLGFSGFDLSTGFKANMSDAGSSGLSMKQKNPKKRKITLLR